MVSQAGKAGTVAAQTHTLVSRTAVAARRLVGYKVVAHMVALRKGAVHTVAGHTVVHHMVAVRTDAHHNVAVHKVAVHTEAVGHTDGRRDHTGAGHMEAEDNPADHKERRILHKQDGPYHSWQCFGSPHIGSDP